MGLISNFILVLAGITIFSFFSMLLAENDSICDFKISVKREIKGNGFHRTMNVEVGLTGPESYLFHNNCHLAVYQLLPAGVYVDPEELNELSRSDKSINSFYLEHDKIDVEASKEKSNISNVLIHYHKPKKVTSSTPFQDLTLNNSANAVILFKYSLPIHSRYHAPRYGGGYEQVKIPRSSLLVKCFLSDNSHKSPLSSITSPPCTKNSLFGASESCITVSDHSHRTLCNDWKSIVYEYYNEKRESQIPLDDRGKYDARDELLLVVPVGNLDHLRLVQIVTLILTNCATIYVIYFVHITNEHEKQIEEDTKGDE